jgi:hypothetical protein
MSKTGFVHAVVITMMAFGVEGCAGQTGDASGEAAASASSALGIADPDGPEDRADDATGDGWSDTTNAISAGAETLATSGIARWSLGRSKATFFAYGQDKAGRTVQSLALTPQPNGGVRADLTTASTTETVQIDGSGRIARGALGAATRSFHVALARDVAVVGGSATNLGSVFAFTFGRPIGCAAAVAAANLACTGISVVADSQPRCVAAVNAAVVACKA